MHKSYIIFGNSNEFKETLVYSFLYFCWVKTQVKIKNLLSEALGYIKKLYIWVN